MKRAIHFPLTLIAAALAGACVAPAHRTHPMHAEFEARMGAPSLESDRPAIELGIETQVYPAGLISAARAGLEISERAWVFVRAGYNATDRQDFGEHDDERGGGPGLGAGYRHFFGPERTGWLAGARLDLWALQIDWKDRNAGVDQRGTTDVLVLLPAIEAGYCFALGDGAWRLEFTLAFGAEINVATQGESVGEGAILLGGVSLSRGF